MNRNGEWSVTIEEIWKKYYQPLKSYMDHRIKDHTETEDLLQDVFIKAEQHFKDLEDENTIRFWLYKIARNRLIDYYRSEKRFEELPIDLQNQNESDALNFTKEAAACIRETMQRLPEKYASALEFTEFQGLTQRELSQKLGISYSGAKSRVQRGREKLKKAMQGCCHIEADPYGNITDFRVLDNKAK